MDVSSCPSHPALPRNPSIKQLRSSLTTVPSPGRFHSLSFIHSFIHPFFLSSGALSLPIIISCPQTASVLVPVSAGLSNSPALISQLLQIKREVSGDYSKPSYERERKPTFHTQGEQKHRLPFMGLSKGLAWRRTGETIKEGERL